MAALNLNNLIELDEKLAIAYALDVFDPETSEYAKFFIKKVKGMDGPEKGLALVLLISLHISKIPDQLKCFILDNIYFEEDRPAVLTAVKTDYHALFLTEEQLEHYVLFFERLNGKLEWFLNDLLSHVPFIPFQPEIKLKKSLRELNQGLVEAINFLKAKNILAESITFYEQARVPNFTFFVQVKKYIDACIPLYSTWREDITNVFQKVMDINNAFSEKRINSADQFDTVIQYYAEEKEVLLYKSLDTDKAFYNELAKIRLECADKKDIRIGILFGFTTNWNRGPHGLAITYIKENDEEALYITDTSPGLYSFDKEGLIKLFSDNQAKAIDIYYVTEDRIEGSGCWEDAIKNAVDCCKKNKEGGYYIPALLGFLKKNSQKTGPHFFEVKMLLDKLLKTVQNQDFLRQYRMKGDINSGRLSKRFETLPQFLSAFRDDIPHENYLPYRKHKMLCLSELQKKAALFKEPQTRKQFRAFYREHAMHFVMREKSPTLSEVNFTAELEHLFSKFKNK
jgi:hypothetical protein